jgi:hypothetical protein
VLLLAQLDEVSELLRPSFLGVSCSIVYPLADDEPFLLGESIKILFSIQRICSFLTHLRQFVGGLWIHFPNNLLFSELLSLDLLLGHSLSDPLDVIEAIILVERFIEDLILILHLSRVTNLVAANWSSQGALILLVIPDLLIYLLYHFLGS